MTITMNVSAQGRGRTRRQVLCSTTAAGAALAAACTPQPLLKQREVVTVAVPAGSALYEDIAAAVEQAVGPANGAAGANYAIQTVRFNVPERASSGTSAFAQAVAPLLGRERPADVVLVVSRQNDVATPAGEVRELVSLRLLAPLDEFLQGDKTYKTGDFYPAALDALRHKGQSYARPLTVEPLVLYYDPELFGAGGVRPPDAGWSWQVLRESARRLTRLAPDGQVDQWGIYSFPPHWYLLLFIWQNGGDLFTRDRKAAAITEPAAVEALQFLYDLVVVHRVAPPPPAFGRQYEYALRLQDGKIYAGGRARVGLALGPGAANLRQVLLELGLPDVRLGIGMAEVPQGRQRATGVRVVSALALTSKAANKDAAYRALSALEREASKNLPLTARRTTAAQLRQVEPSLSEAHAQVLANALGYARVPPLDNMLLAPQVVGALWQTAIGSMFFRNLTAAEAATATARQLDDLVGR